MTPDMVLAAMPLAGLFLLIILPVILTRIWQGRPTASIPGNVSQVARKPAL